MDAKKLVLRFAPYWVQDLLISIYNTHQYRRRRSGNYLSLKKFYREAPTLDSARIEKMAAERMSGFLAFARKHSAWYGDVRGERLEDFPVLEKADLLKNFGQITTIAGSKAVVSLTGGTTGASMKVHYTLEDLQERFAILDAFRESFGYAPGRRVAWFSGKSIVSPRDLTKGRCYRDDWINKIRFFSTFHISRANFEIYWRALENYAPEFLVGFPSSVFEICRFAQIRGLKATWPVKVFFPTAEAVSSVQCATIEAVLGCRIANQYASSEGAPFILECAHGRLHIHPLSGVFEVVDEQMHPAPEGEILVTSFTTHGTPLVRYRIGDRIALEEAHHECTCGSGFPLVKWIDGRRSDFIWSPEFGRVTSGNISNCTKDVDGIVCFQIRQAVPDSVDVAVVASDEFTQIQEARFLKALRLRVGPSMKIECRRVEEIARERSGKFRIVNNVVDPSLMN